MPLKRASITEAWLKTHRSENPRSASNESAIPARYTDFAAWVGVELSVGQRALARIAYDGDSFADLTAPELEAARTLFGPIDSVPVGARHVVAAVCGGRGGKTYCLVSLRLVWGMLVRDLRSLAPGQHAVALVVAPNDKLRQEAVNYAMGIMRSRPELRKLLSLPRGTNDKDTVASFSVVRPDGHKVTFEAGVATRGGYGGRGRSLTDAALDEVAFFRDSSAKVNDEDIFKAASPRVLPGGQVILASTPWAQGGLLYATYAKNWGKPQDALVAHASTEMLNPSPWVSEMVAREKARDPDNAAREFDAQFMSGGTLVFFELSTIEQAIDETL